MNSHFFNRKNLLAISFSILLSMSAMVLYAQQAVNEVRGKVNDDAGLPLRGATITARSTSGGVVLSTSSDEQGSFRFTKLAPAADYSFTFSFTGFVTETLSGYRISETSSITLDPVTLRYQVSALDEVIVVGYGTSKKSELSTAISRVSSKDLSNQAVNNLSEAMAGKMAGVQVAQGSGRPGAGLSIRVRGISTITAGSEPLYVVDGVPINGSQLNNINTNDIESIDVLKDAASAAIYGSRGSNGIVIITTKMGQKGKTSFSYNTFHGLQSVAKTIDMMDAYQYAEVARDARNNTYTDQMQAINRQRAAQNLAPIQFGLNDDNATRLANSNNNTSTIIPAEIVPYLNGTPGLTNTNWQDEIFRSAPMQSHSMSVSGGTDSLKFYGSFEYFDQDGIIINSNFKRFSSRFNLEGKSGIIKYGVGLSPSVVNQKLVSADGLYTAGGVIASALHYSPIFPVYNPDGSYSFAQNAWSSDTRTILTNGNTLTGNGQTQVWNPVALAMLKDDRQQEIKFLGNAFVEANIFKSLKYKTSIGIDMGTQRNDDFLPSTIPLSNTAGNPESEATANSSTNQRMNWIWENTLNFNKRISEHSIDGLAGWSVQKFHSDANSANATRGFISNQIGTLNAGLVTNGGSNESEWSLASALARVQYNYSSTYLLTAAVRMDGASRFGLNSKWGTFPSVSLGWRLSNEPFLRNVSQVGELKLRASYGLTGNFNIPNYGWQGGLSYNGYVLGGTSAGVVNGASPSSRPNPDLKWEKTAQLNVGMDAAFFNNGINLTLDYYNSNTNGLLLDVPIPLSTGLATELRNIGKVNNKGFEITLGTQQRFGEVNWTASANYARNINTVKALGPGNADLISTGGTSNTYFLTRVGYPIGSYFLPKMIGIFQSQAEIDSYPHFVDGAANWDLATTKPGDNKFLDADGDGVINFTDDRVILGSYAPKFTYGFNTTLAWNNIDFGISFQGVYGNQIVNLTRRYFYNAEGNMNNYANVYHDRFISESNPGNGVMRANRVSKGGNGTTSSWHVEDGSYLRIRNINLGYRISDKVLKRSGFISAARIYLTMQNPFTFTKYSGYNPEVSNRSEVARAGEDMGVYPLAKTNSLGLNLTF